MTYSVLPPMNSSYGSGAPGTRVRRFGGGTWQYRQLISPELLSAIRPSARRSGKMWRIDATRLSPINLPAGKYVLYLCVVSSKCNFFFRRF